MRVLDKKLGFHKPAGSKNGLWITQQDLEVLHHLYICKTLTTQQLCDYYGCISDQKVETFSKKLYSKFAKFQVVKTYQMSLGQIGFYVNYYRLSTGGIELLFQYGFVTEGEKNKFLEQSHKPRTLVTHTLATQEVINQAVINGIKEQKTVRNVSNQIMNVTKGSLFPDGLIEISQTEYVAIELDNDTEPLKKLEEKLIKYVAFAEENPDKQYYLIYSLLDDSFRGRYTQGEKLMRTFNLKKRLVGNKGVFHDNLHVYVTPLRRTHSLIKRIMLGKENFSSKEMRGFLEQLFLDKQSLYDDFKGEIIPTLVSIPKLDDLVHYHFNYRDEQGTSYTIAVLYMREGNMVDFDNLMLLLSRNEKERNHGHTSFERIIVVYSSTDEAEGEVIPVEKIVGITSIETLLDFEQPLHISTSSSLYRRKVSDRLI